jgi:citrate lyase subunit beta/citryl-CoA lyase
MGCIHPRQIRVIHEGFRPGQDEIEKARHIVEAFREANAKGLGVTTLGSKMIDPPVVRRAEQILELAARFNPAES